MIDLKLSKRSKTEKGPEVAHGSIDKPDYPYGTRLTFDEEQVAKSEFLKAVENQQVVKVTAIARVVAKRSESRDGKPSRSVEIQIEKIDFEDGGESEKEDGFDAATESDD